MTGLAGSAAEQAGEIVGGEVGDAIRGFGGNAAESVGAAVGESTKKAFDNLFGSKDEE